MRTFLFLIIACFFIATSSYSYAKNPGTSAMNCVSVSTNGQKYDNLIFKNNCSTKIFVVWCGDLRSSKKECGDGYKGTFYTHSKNIAANSKRTTTLNGGGSYRYAACIGRIGFGSKGITHPSNGNGSFTCTK